jgi:hypothetical protein
MKMQNGDILITGIHSVRNQVLARPLVKNRILGGND